MDEAKHDGVWIEEFCYFGLHESQTYRRRGSRVQSRVELCLSVEVKDGIHPNKGIKDFIAGVSGVTEFLHKYQDCFFSVHSGYQTKDGTEVPPSLYLLGWVDVLEDEMYIYESDKKYIVASRPQTP